MRIFKKISIIGFIIFIYGLTLIGCAMMKKPAPDSAELDPATQNQLDSIPGPAPFYSELPPSEGSLFTDSSNMLFADKKARKVGDILTIDIVENTSSKIDVNTSASKETKYGAGVSNMFGLMRWLESNNAFLNAGGNGNLLSFDSSSEHTGAGSSDRSGEVTASIGARIIEVFPNGNCHIYGRREMMVNNETQIITITGVVRPEDISAGNRVQSPYISDARITYSGKGILADKQKPGWFTQILDKVWPF